MYVFTLLFNILTFAFGIALAAGFFVLLYFVVKKAVKDGMIEANTEIKKRDGQESC